MHIFYIIERKLFKQFLGNLSILWRQPYHFLSSLSFPDHFLFLYVGRPTTLAEMMKKTEMWLIRSYWDLEFPRPVLPNVVFIGGHHCKPAKPLPKVNKCLFVHSCTVVFSGNGSTPFLQFSQWKRCRKWGIESCQWKG